jgi:ADP-ribosylglycohydrolase
MPAIVSPQKEKAVGSFIAAAVGDALGWPLEGRARRMQSTESLQQKSLPTEFTDWIRSGSRSEPYREPIHAGEYSDDTQLLLATARSILHCAKWWEHFTSVELPFWLLYQRGGGGATKRAAQLWLAGTAPWESSRGRDQYFEAGGNGVCMRILPHMLASPNENASEVARQIILNGISTHGHPRALVGALLHGMALRLSLRQQETLEFGALIEAVYREFPDWARLSDIPTQWGDVFSGTQLQYYKGVWDETVRETMSLIQIARESLRLGPLSVGPETLQKMGALNPKTSGSGTITAAASLFLASRYAASPHQGMLVAATTLGADTDTLASMVASLLGAIHGEEWLGRFATSVQDANYIRKLAAKLIAGIRVPVEAPVPKVTKSENEKFASSLKSLGVGAEIRLPDKRRAAVKRVEPMFSQTAEADLCVIEAEDGQTLGLRRLIRGSKREKPVRKEFGKQDAENILRVGIKIFVNDLTKARDFYVNKLRFPVDKEYSTGFTVAGIISVHIFGQRQGDFSFRGNTVQSAIPCIRVASISATAARLAKSGINTTPVAGNHSYKALEIVDPFGNRLEIFEA